MSWWINSFSGCTILLRNLLTLNIAISLKRKEGENILWQETYILSFKKTNKILLHRTEIPNPGPADWHWCSPAVRDQAAKRLETADIGHLYSVFLIDEESWKFVFVMVLNSKCHVLQFFLFAAFCNFTNVKHCARYQRSCVRVKGEMLALYCCYSSKLTNAWLMHPAEDLSLNSMRFPWKLFSELIYLLGIVYSIAV